ncbi:MAG: aminotransferase [Thermaerobacter sp.]|nr:aminotransferase [Thermaerobacter sp.]
MEFTPQWSAHDLAEHDRQHVWHPLTQHTPYLAGQHPLIIARGQASTVFDTEGTPYLDAAAGLWCVNVGYDRQELIAAGIRQLQELAYYPLTQSHPAAIRLAARLAEYLVHTPHFFFSNSGSEANEVAFKAVRQYWRQQGYADKTKIISRYRGYHGSTLGALSATGQPERKRGYGPLAGDFIQVSPPYCYRCPFGLSHPTCGLQCAADFERRIQIEGPDTVAAVMVEPVIAGGGVLVAPPGYLAAVEAICRRHQVLLIVDEVVTGFGRTGRMFGYEHDGVSPDVVTMAKGLASGYMPIGATAFSQRIFDGFLGDAESGRHFRHVNTFGGHPVATAVSLANLEVLASEGLVERAARLGDYLLGELRSALAGSEGVGDIRGLGLLVGVELVDPSSGGPVSTATMRRVARQLIQNGIVAGKTTDIERDDNNVVILAPPLVMTSEEGDRLVSTLAAGIRNILTGAVPGY